MKRTFLLVISLALYSCSAPPHHDVNEPPGESAMSRAYTAFAIQDMATVPEGMEIAWQKVRVYDPQSRAVLQESETGQMDNHIYQRAARPWTWLGPEEPYIYEYRLVSDVAPSGHEIEVTQILKTPNVSPAARDEAYEMEPPQVSLVSADLDRHMYEDEEGMVRIPVSMLVKGVSRWNRPLRPRPEAGEAEQQLVRQSQLDYDRNRQLEIEQVTADFRRELEELGAVHVSITGSNGWILADIPLEVLDILSLDARLAAISPAREENVDNYCNYDCDFASNCRHGETGCCQFDGETGCIPAGVSRWETDEWFLGDGARTQRFDAQQFYDNGIHGNYPQGPYNSLVVGIMETGLYEDEAFFDKWANGVSRAKKYECEEYCTFFFLKCWSWETRCVQRFNFADTETDCEPLQSGTNPYWQAGCHGTGVASIAIGRNYDNLMNGHNLGDRCFFNVIGAPEHCPSLYHRSQGMAPEAKPIYIAFWNNDYRIKALGKFMEEEVDVINMSFGPGATDSNLCNPMISSSFQSELENAFDQGIFLVNSTGNFGRNHHNPPNPKTKDDCLTNPAATLPKVFAVAGLLNRPYQYGIRNIVVSDPGDPLERLWAYEFDYRTNQALWPTGPDDYFNMRVDPFASQTGGATLKINNQNPYVGAMTVVDLVAPKGGFNTTRPEGTNGQLNDFFGGSSGAAPHVSGLSMLVKHHFLQIGFSWVNFPGWLHTIMLAMGDRSFFNTGTLSMAQKVSGGDRIYGFGKIKLRRPLAGHFRPISKTWTAGNFPSSPYGYTEMIWPNPATSSHKFVKGVMNQIEDMTGKSPNDMVSDFAISLAQTNQTYSGPCPTSFETACVHSGTCTYTSDESRDVKKMVRRYSSTGMQGRCHYVQILKRHITSHNASVQVFFYRMDRRDHENSN